MIFRVMPVPDIQERPFKSALLMTTDALCSLCIIIIIIIIVHLSRRQYIYSHVLRCRRSIVSARRTTYTIYVVTGANANTRNNIINEWSERNIMLCVREFTRIIPHASWHGRHTRGRNVTCATNVICRFSATPSRYHNNVIFYSCARLASDVQSPQD